MAEPTTMDTTVNPHVPEDIRDRVVQLVRKKTGQQEVPLVPCLTSPEAEQVIFEHVRRVAYTTSSNACMTLVVIACVFCLLCVHVVAAGRPRHLRARRRRVLSAQVPALVGAHPACQAALRYVYCMVTMLDCGLRGFLIRRCSSPLRGAVCVCMVLWRPPCCGTVYVQRSSATPTRSWRALLR